MVYHGVFFCLYCICFPLFCLCLISCIYAFLVAVSVSFRSAFASLCWFRLQLLFFLLQCLHVCQVSAFLRSFSVRLQVVFFSILLISYLSVAFSRLVLCSGTKPKRGHKCNFHDKQFSMDLASRWQSFSQSYYDCDYYHCHCWTYFCLCCRHLVSLTTQHLNITIITTTMTTASATTDGTYC